MTSGTALTHPSKPAEGRRLRLLLGLTGSAGLMSMSTYLEEFRARLNPEIRIVLTGAAERIVPKNTWLALGPGGVYGDADWVSAEHVALSLWPDLILVAPCTANTLASVATGRCDNLLTATIVCAHVPVLLAPNMNPLMLANKAVQRSIATIKADGHRIVDMEPSLIYAFGTRSSREDLGMASPDTLVKLIEESVSPDRRD
jgi:phosphopantothenoylcysteine decarboxylase/phosphopantothenate--cysteine ligase